MKTQAGSWGKREWGDVANGLDAPRSGKVEGVVLKLVLLRLLLLPWWRNVRGKGFGRGDD